MQIEVFTAAGCSLVAGHLNQCSVLGNTVRVKENFGLLVFQNFVNIVRYSPYMA
jgi:hypothetical protein